MAEKLKTCTSEVEFEQWYEAEILKKNELKNDKITFGKAIKKVEDDFWSRLSRTKQKRDKDNPSDINSWRETYGKFYKHASLEKPFDTNEVQNILARYKRGTETFNYTVSALKKLAEMNRRRDIHEALSEIDVTQTEFTKLQTIDLKQFIDWRDRTLGITASLHKNSKDFRDKSKLTNPNKACKSKTKRLAFWQEFIDQVGAIHLIKVKTRKTDLTMYQDKFNWLEKMASKTLAKVFYLIGHERFVGYVYGLVRLEESRFTPQDRKEIEYLRNHFEYLNLD